MKKILVLISLLVVTFVSFSQEPTAPLKNLTNGTVSEQFDYINKISNNYQDFKVIKKDNMRILKINVLDSLNEKNEAIQTYLLEIDNRNQQINSLKEKLIEANNNITTTTEEKDSISFFGSLIKKDKYKSIMWGIVGLLSLILAFFGLRSFQNGVAKKEAKSALAIVQEELDQLTKRSLEREQKLMRDLQDERNKHF